MVQVNDRELSSSDVLWSQHLSEIVIYMGVFLAIERGVSPLFGSAGMYMRVVNYKGQYQRYILE